MKTVEIKLKKKAFGPGETVEGEVIIRSKKTAACESAVLHINGHEKTEVIRRDGITRKTYTEDIWLMDDKMTLMEGGTVHAGEERLPFKFTLKKNLPASYSGVGGRITYGLRAEIILDSERYTADVDLQIVRPLEHIAPRPEMHFIKCDGATQIQIETPRNTFTPGEPIPVRLFVHGDPNIRGVRFEFLHEEISTAKDKSSIVMRQLATAYFKKENLESGKWLNLRFRTDAHWPRTFTSHLIRSEIIMKVTADIPFKVDKSVIFQLFESASQSELFEHDELISEK